jgi:copper(I)-binding protein
MKRPLFTVMAAVVFFSVFLLPGGCKEAVPVLAIESPEAAISPMWLGAASVFMKIANTGGGDDILVSARTDIPGTITEMHDIRDGKMVKVESISIPAKEGVVLRPAKYHLMIFKMPKTMKEGAKLTLFLTFKKSGEKAISLELTTFAPGRRAMQN